MIKYIALLIRWLIPLVLFVGLIWFVKDLIMNFEREWKNFLFFVGAMYLVFFVPLNVWADEKLNSEPKI